MNMDHDQSIQPMENAKFDFARFAVSRNSTQESHLEKDFPHANSNSSSEGEGFTYKSSAAKKLALFSENATTLGMGPDFGSALTPKQVNDISSGLSARKLSDHYSALMNLVVDEERPLIEALRDQMLKHEQDIQNKVSLDATSILQSPPRRRLGPSIEDML